MDTTKVLLIFSIFVLSKGMDKLLPRGISVSQHALYDSLQDFTCLDGSLRLPFIYVNDDYCDCPDGSDEPGTSACPNGRFHCSNVGYIPLELPTSRVNDGVCDCCDASDEYLSDNCTNVCYLLGAEAKKAAEKEAEIVSQGNELRLQMIATGKQIKQQRQERLSVLESERLEATRVKDEASRLKEVAESAEFTAVEAYRAKKEEQKENEMKLEKLKLEQEAREVFQQIDTNGDNVLQSEELIGQEVFDKNSDGQVTESELRFLFNTNNDISWDSFLEGWPKLKTIFESEKEHLDSEPEKEQDELTGEFNNEESTPESPAYFEGDQVNVNREVDEEWDGREESKTGEEEEEEEEEEKQEEDKQDDELEENKPEIKYDEHTLKLIEDANQARSRFESAERSLQDVEREYTRLKESLEKDYGSEDEYVPLDGQCYSYSDREYTYKLCPFDQIVQMGKSGGSETRLGMWAGWLEESQYKVMLYDKGQTCWNGPQRSTKVTLSCGLETAVIGASEPNKCEYELTLVSPAACKLTGTSHQVDTHDEF